ncbi:hypothetical protein [Metabacillus sediminilitoris]|uniref:Flagellar hook-length control protein-like C-terminal domain-containing protein n=1 Tax=Metabacillus sediminilitoris TaxID=2567941 RepID=A0A4S4CAZ1_9BACI|nr:hypothetical protein [Metabacillus sediminilitoris]QGQ46874.1 hypothetical protein GMB29_17495 [Metabacillus sediminilitoris]THF83022.1 hypothetical protein E6W99_01240 [Metabacillus sediminilitoris]
MDHISVITKLFQHATSQMSRPHNQLALKENQIVMGQVLKHFPEQKALIQVGNTKLVAQLETSIDVMRKYWFKVKGSEQSVMNLKIVKQVEGNNHIHLAAAKDLLSLFQQQTSKENMMLTNEFIKENIPITKEQLMTAASLLNKMPKSDRMEAIQTIITAIKKDFPLTEVVVRSLKETQSNIPLAKQIHHLFNILQHDEHQFPGSKQLSDLLTNFIHKQIDFNVRENMKELYSLKTSLILASKEVLLPSLREQIDQLVFRLNGQSLLYQDNGPTQEMISHIPLFMNNHQTDLTVQWNGKKQADGTIDPAFCRILFYLQLPKLKELMIDVQIQNRVMNITIRNNSGELSNKVASYSNELKEALNKMNFYVTSIQIKPFDEKDIPQGMNIEGSNFTHVTTSYKGVDLKI